MAKIERESLAYEINIISNQRKLMAAYRKRKASSSYGENMKHGKWQRSGISIIISGEKKKISIKAHVKQSQRACMAIKYEKQ